MRKILLLSAVLAYCLAAASAAENATPSLPNRLAAARVGEWVVYSIPDGYTQKHTVVERVGEGAAARVAIRVENMADGEVVDTIEMVEIAGEPVAQIPPIEEEGVAVDVNAETFDILGKRFEGYVIEVFRSGESYQTWRITPDLPVYGIAARTTNDGGHTDFAIVDYSGK